MKLLVYSNCPLDPALGSGKARLRFIEGLRSRGHEVRVVVPDEMELCPRIRVGKRFRLALGALRHARRTLARGKFDAVAINGGEFGWLARWLRRQPRRPFLVHHTDGCELLAGGPPPAKESRPRSAGWIEKLHGSLNRAAFREVDACVVSCPCDRDHLRRIGYQPPERLQVVPLGLDDEYLDHPEPGPRPPRLVFLGSWIRRKGVKPLVAATVKMLLEFPGLEMDLLGTGKSAAELHAEFPAALQGRIQVVTGRLTSGFLTKQLPRASIFVLPSYYEGYGLATAEAMACGCAAITTRTGFGSDLRDGEDALLVPFDDPEALARAIRRLIVDDGLRLRISRAGWRRVQSHRWKESVQLLEATYLRWLTP